MKALVYPTVRWAQETPQAIALIANPGAITYAELESRIVIASKVLFDLGVRPGDRVIICAGNSPDWVIAAHAIARIGAVLAPITVRLTEAEANAHRLSLAPALILTDAERFPFWSGGNKSVPALTLDEFSNRCEVVGSSASPVSDEIDPEKLHSIVATSGTGGVPKGVCLSFRSHLANALASAVNLGVLPEDRWLLNLPLYHVGGLAIILRAALYGTAVVIAESNESQETVDCIRERRVTQLSLVSTTLQRLLQSPIRRFPDHLRTVLVGGGPVPEDLISEGIARGLPILPTYGMTETASQAATAAHHDVVAGVHTARPLCLAELGILDDSDAELPSGFEGRIHIRGPIVAMGYWQTGGRIVPLADKSGWFATSDVGGLDEDGRLTVRGRIDNVIISGGEKIHAEELEAILAQIEGVANAVVIPIEDQNWGQRPLAIVEPMPGYIIDANSIGVALSTRLPRYKLPVQIVIVPQLPLLPSGKIDRQALMAKFRSV